MFPVQLAAVTRQHIWVKAGYVLKVIRIHYGLLTDVETDLDFASGPAPRPGESGRCAAGRIAYSLDAIFVPKKPIPNPVIMIFVLTTQV